LYETKVMRAAPPGRMSSPVEDRLMGLRHKDLQEIMRERGVVGTALRDKREMVLRLAEDIRDKQDEYSIFDYEERYGTAAANRLG
jgi:hypothetical protein